MTINISNIMHLKSHKTAWFLPILIVAAVGLFFLCTRNPYQDIQQNIMQSAAKIHSYYRDRPGYWQLSTNTAKEDGLLVQSLWQYAEYDIQVGHGTNGESSLPSDMSFNIVLHHLNKSACINLSEAAIDADTRLILRQITIINNKQKTEYSWGGNPSLPIKKYEARDNCDISENTVVWSFN